MGIVYHYRSYSIFLTLLGIVLLTAAVLKGLDWFFPSQAEVGSGVFRGFVAVYRVTWIVAVATGLWLVGSATAQFVGGPDSVTRPGAAGAVALDPGRWLNEPLPRLGMAEEDGLRAGNWLLILYRRDCRACRAELPRALKEWRASGGGTKVALIEVPSPAAGDLGPIVPAGRADFECRLPENASWLVRTPLLIVLREGVVRGYASSVEELQSRSGAGGLRFAKGADR